MCLRFQESLHGAEGAALSIRVLPQLGGLPPGMPMVRMPVCPVLGRRQVQNGGRPPVPGSPAACESGAGAPQALLGVARFEF